jgi:hypothetical protein
MWPRLYAIARPCATVASIRRTGRWRAIAHDWGPYIASFRYHFPPHTMHPLPTTSEGEHGGNLEWAIREFGGTHTECLDLSTGIHPQGYTVSAVPPEYWLWLPGAKLVAATEAAARPCVPGHDAKSSYCRRRDASGDRSATNTLTASHSANYWPNLFGIRACLPPSRTRRHGDDVITICGRNQRHRCGRQSQ